MSEERPETILPRGVRLRSVPLAMLGCAVLLVLLGADPRQDRFVLGLWIAMLSTPLLGWFWGGERGLELTSMTMSATRFGRRLGTYQLSELRRVRNSFTGLYFDFPGGTVAFYDGRRDERQKLEQRVLLLARAAGADLSFRGPLHASARPGRTAVVVVPAKLETGARECLICGADPVGQVDLRFYRGFNILLASGFEVFKWSVSTCEQHRRAAKRGRALAAFAALVLGLLPFVLLAALTPASWVSLVFGLLLAHLLHQNVLRRYADAWGLGIRLLEKGPSFSHLVVEVADEEVARRVNDLLGTRSSPVHLRSQGEATETGH